VVWDLTDPATLPKLLTGHISRITSLAYGGKGQVIASGSADGSIFLWDLTGNDAVGQPLAGPNASVAALAIDAREDLLAVGFADGSILIWNINPEAWQQRACERAGRNMTEAEWEKYLQGVPYSVTCP
jgi:WD40 repeat protein